MKKEVLKIKKLAKDASVPEYAFSSDVGFDLRANETINIAPYEQKQIKTGLAMEIPENNVGLIRDRVGIVTEMGVHTVAGTFDPGFRGEVSVVLVNFADESVQIEKGMRIAQMIVIPVVRAKIREVRELKKTERNDKIGVTGINEIKKIEKEIMKRR